MSNSDGSLMVVRPHAEFRIFLLVDPIHGELSRPLRNRGIEIFISPFNLENDEDVEEMIMRANNYTRSPNASNLLFNALRIYSTDRKLGYAL
jgi:midasin (ATPase involved in ribosome maturation)